MITHEEVRDVVLSINDDDFECRFTNRMNLIEDYIDQQEKKDRLLELYQERHKVTQSYIQLKNLLRFKNKQTHKEKYFELLVI